MTEIEELWKRAKSDDEHKLMNGSLLEQSTFICVKCGHEKETPMKCSSCGDNGDCDG